jgi:hypothetical protein
MLVFDESFDPEYFAYPKNETTKETISESNTRECESGSTIGVATSRIELSFSNPVFMTRVI